MHTSVQTQIHTRAHKQTLTRKRKTYTHIHTHTHAHTYTHTHTHTHTLTHKHTLTRMHIHMHVHACVYIIILYMLPNFANVYTKFLQDIWMTSVCTAISGNGALDGRYGSDIHHCVSEKSLRPSKHV